MSVRARGSAGRVLGERRSGGCKRDIDIYRQILCGRDVKPVT